MLFASPREKVTEFGLRYEVGLLSMLSVLEDYSLPTIKYVVAGENLVAAAQSAATAAGLLVDATVDNLTARAGLQWPPGTPYLTIVNELLAAAGYWAAHVDGSGVVQMSPYVSPQHREASYLFSPGAAAIHLPDYERTRDIAAVPNKYIVISPGTDTLPALVGVAEHRS